MFSFCIHCIESYLFNCNLFYRPNDYLFNKNQTTLLFCIGDCERSRFGGGWGQAYNFLARSWRARTRPDILSMVLGPCVQYCPCEGLRPQSKKMGAKIELKVIELSYCHHYIFLKTGIFKNNVKIGWSTMLIMGRIVGQQNRMKNDRVMPI